MVGCSDIDSYGIFPADGAALLRHLAAGAPPDEAEHWYTRTYGETVDLPEFLAVLSELGFLATSGPTGGWKPLHLHAGSD